MLSNPEIFAKIDVHRCAKLFDNLKKLLKSLGGLLKEKEEEGLEEGQLCTK